MPGKNKTPLLRTGCNKLLVSRAMTSAAVVSSMFYAFRNMPIGDASVITSTSPVFATLFGCCCLKERFGVFEASTLAISLAGITLVIQPPVIFGHVSEESGNQPLVFLPVALCFIAAVASALNMVLSRAMKHIDLFVMSAWIGFVSALPPLAYSVYAGFEHDTKLPEWSDLPYACLIGFQSWTALCLSNMAVRVSTD